MTLWQRSLNTLCLSSLCQSLLSLCFLPGIFFMHMQLHRTLHPGQLLSRSQGLKPEPLVGEGRQLWPGLGAGPGQAGAPRCRGPRNSDPSGQDAPTATGAFGESYSPTHHATQTPRGSGRGPDPAWCLGSPIASGGEAPPHAPQSRGLIFSQD